MSSHPIPWRNVRHHWEMYLFILPTLILVGLFQYYPAFSGVWHSFYRWNGADIAEFVGLANFIGLLTNTDFWRSFELAFTLGVWNVVKMVPALAVAVCIHRCRRESVQFLYKMLFVIPMVIPSLVIVLIWRSFFFEATAGYLNRFLRASGLFNLLVWLDSAMGWGGLFQPGSDPAWLGDPKLIIAACIIWGFPWVGSFAVLTYLAKLNSIPKDVYEAADVDGISWWTKFTQIEFPLITTSIKMLLVFVIIDTIKDAGMILALAGMEGGPGGNATVPALFMLRKAFIDQDMGYACAVGLVLTAVVMGLQKLSNLLTAWGDMGAKSKALLRGAGFAAGAALLCSGHFRALGLLFAAISLPYETAADAWHNFLDARRRRKASNADYRAPHTGPVASFLLRALKHATILGVLSMAMLPLYLMLIVSLKDNQQFYSKPGVPTTPFHWENWPAAYDMITPCLANSVFISVSATFCTLFLGLSGAYFFARHRMPLSSFLWNAILILLMMPAIANLIPLFRLLRDMSLLNTLSALIIVGASTGQIFAIFVLRNFVEDIPKDLFEAAEIDGATHFQQMRIIVLPLAGPMLGTVGVMTFISQWNDFVLPLIIMRDHSRLPVMVQLLRMAGEYIKFWGPLMAGYAMASIPIIILFMFTIRLFTRGLTEGAVKG